MHSRAHRHSSILEHFHKQPVRATARARVWVVRVGGWVGGRVVDRQTGIPACALTLSKRNLSHSAAHLFGDPLLIRTTVSFHRARREVEVVKP